MASENIRLAESIKDDILSCPICFEVFTDPKTLPCLHTYCKSCLLKLVEIKNKKIRILRCPECRAEMRLFKNGVEDLKSSFFIHSLMEIYNTKRQIVTCTVCKQRGNTRNAVSKCTTCGDGLCQQCSSGHLLSTMTVRHTIVPLKDFASGAHDSSLRETQNFPCGVHDKELEYYCNCCEVVACLSCVLLEHKDHMYTSIDKAFENKKESLEAMFKEVQSKVMDIEVAKTQVLELKNQANKKSLEITKTITNTGQTVLNAVSREISETKKNAEKVIKPRLERLKHISEDLEQKIKQGKTSIEFCKSILATGKPVEVLQIESLLRKRLHQLSQEDSMVNISETEFSTRIEDIYINKRFRDEVTLGIFQPDPKANKVSVCETETQTEVSWFDIMTNGKKYVAYASADLPDAALFAGSNDSGWESQTGSRSMSEELNNGDRSLQDGSSGSQSNGVGDTSTSHGSDGCVLRKREGRSDLGHGEPADVCSIQVDVESESKGHNWFTDIPGDPEYGNATLLNDDQPSPAYFDYVIHQVLVLLAALVLLFLSPILWEHGAAFINEHWSKFRKTL